MCCIHMMCILFLHLHIIKNLNFVVSGQRSCIASVIQQKFSAGFDSTIARGN